MGPSCEGSRDCNAPGRSEGRSPARVLASIAPAPAAEKARLACAASDIVDEWNDDIVAPVAAPDDDDVVPATAEAGAEAGEEIMAPVRLLLTVNTCACVACITGSAEACAPAPAPAPAAAPKPYVVVDCGSRGPWETRPCPAPTGMMEWRAATTRTSDAVTALRNAAAHFAALSPALRATQETTSTPLTAVPPMSASDSRRQTE